MSRLTAQHEPPKSRLRERLRSKRLLAAANDPQDLTQLAELIADVQYRANTTRGRVEHNRTNRSAASLRNNPFDHNEETAEMLYAAWTRQMKQDRDLTARMDELFPIIERHDDVRYEQMNTPLSHYDEDEDYLESITVGMIA